MPRLWWWGLLGSSHWMWPLFVWIMYLYSVQGEMCHLFEEAAVVRSIEKAETSHMLCAKSPLISICQLQSRGDYWYYRSLKQGCIEPFLIRFDLCSDCDSYFDERRWQKRASQIDQWKLTACFYCETKNIKMSSGEQMAHTPSQDTPNGPQIPTGRGAAGKPKQQHPVASKLGSAWCPSSKDFKQKSSPICLI